MASQYTILNENKDLNLEATEEEDVQNPFVLSKNLSKLMKNIKGANMMDDSTIDYQALVQSEVYKVEYARMSEQLKMVDLNQLLDKDDAKNDANLLAFFINCYNALTIHSLAHLSTLDDCKIKDGNLLSIAGGKFWAKMAYMIGKDKQVFSLDDIEHGILRANRVHPANGKHQFDKNDPRKKLSVKHVDCRIHFALNCGALSCPPISFYTLENLDRGLALAAQNYLTNETKIDMATKTVELSKLLLWYREDFVYTEVSGNDTLNYMKKALHFSIIAKGVPLKFLTSIKKDDQTLIEYVYQNIRENDEKKQQLKDLCEKEQKELKITYAPYSFDINHKK